MHLTMIEGNDGCIIALKKGLICLIDIYAKVNPGIGETWLCRVKKVNERSLIVTPIEKVIGKSGETDIGQLLKQTVEKHEKIKPKYQFMSKNEIITSKNKP